MPASNPEIFLGHLYGHITGAPARCLARISACLDGSRWAYTALTEAKPLTDWSLELLVEKVGDHDGGDFSYFSVERTFMSERQVGNRRRIDTAPTVGRPL